MACSALLPLHRTILFCVISDHHLRLSSSNPLCSHSTDSKKKMYVLNFTVRELRSENHMHVEGKTEQHFGYMNTKHVRPIATDLEAGKLYNSCYTTCIAQFELYTAFGKKMKENKTIICRNLSVYTSKCASDELYRCVLITTDLSCLQLMLGNTKIKFSNRFYLMVSAAIGQ